MNKISDLKIGDQVATKKGHISKFIKKLACSGIQLEKYHHIHNYDIDWKKTNELNNKQMKELTVLIPPGFEIDKDKSTFEKIVFKEIENKLPMSVEEIPNRKGWYIDSSSKILYGGSKGKNHVSSYERAEAFLALMQLLELRDAWNGDSERHDYLILIYYSKYKYGNLLSFKTAQLRNQFAEQFKDLIETAKELL